MKTIEDEAPPGGDLEQPTEVYVEFPRMLLAKMEALEIHGAAGLRKAVADSAGDVMTYSSAYQYVTGQQVPSSPRLHAIMQTLGLHLVDRERMAYLATLPKRRVEGAPA
jgi:hypothetical protein